MYVSLCRDLAVQLAHRTAAEIARILIPGIHVINLFVNPLKIRVGNDCLSPEDQLSLVGNIERYVGKHTGIWGDDLADFPIAPCYRLCKPAAFVGKHNGQPIHFPGQKSLLIPQPRLKVLHALCLVKGKHGGLMGLLGQFA